MMGWEGKGREGRELTKNIKKNETKLAVNTVTIASTANPCAAIPIYTNTQNKKNPPP